MADKEEPTKALAPITPTRQELVEMGGEFEREDLSVPRLALLQSTSPEVADGLGRPGDLFIKGQNRVIDTRELEIIPILRSKSRILWKDLQNGGGILCQATDGKHGVGAPGGDCNVCPMAEWHGQGKPSCDLYQNVMVVFRQDEDWFPVVISGARTKLKALRELNNLLAMELQKGRPLFSKSYLLKVIQKTGNVGNKYFTFTISPANKNAQLSPEEQQRAYEIFSRFKTVAIQPDAEPESDPSSTASTKEKEF